MHYINIKYRNLYYFVYFLQIIHNSNETQSFESGWVLVSKHSNKTPTEKSESDSESIGSLGQPLKYGYVPVDYLEPLNQLQQQKIKNEVQHRQGLIQADLPAHQQNLKPQVTRKIMQEQFQKTKDQEIQDTKSHLHHLEETVLPIRHQYSQTQFLQVSPQLKKHETIEQDDKFATTGQKRNALNSRPELHMSQNNGNINGAFSSVDQRRVQPMDFPPMPPQIIKAPIMHIDHESVLHTPQAIPYSTCPPRPIYEPKCPRATVNFRYIIFADVCNIQCL